MIKKPLRLVSILLAMSLVACGGSNGGESSGGKSDDKSETPSSSKSSTSRPPTPVLTVSSTDVVAKEGKVYLQISGSTKNIPQEEFKWALALQHIANESLDPLDTYILGGPTFADADYNIDVPIGENGAFVFEYSLSDIPALEPGMFTITTGIKGRSVDVGSVTSGLSAKDGSYRYYLRHDEEVNDINTLVIDSLPPISFEEASVVKIGTTVWAKMGGALKDGITQEILDGYNSFVQFQQVGGSWTNTRRNKASGQFYYEVDGNKAYLYADINFFAADTNYNTHVNVTENKQADLKMDVALDAHYYYKNANDVLLDINVYANPNAASDDSTEFWGNLGFKVTAAPEGTEEGPITPAPEPAGHVHDLQPVEHTVGEDESASVAKKCSEDDYYEISWDAQATTDKKGFSDAGKLSGNDDGFAEYKVWAPVAGEMRLFANMKYNTNNFYDRETKTGDQSIWYDYKESEAGAKHILKVNDAEIDQENQTYKVGEEDVAIYELTFADFGGSSAGEAIEAAWVKFNVTAGINTIRITRHTGYSVSFSSFVLKSILAD